MKGVLHTIEREVEEKGFTFVAESVCDVRSLFALACDKGWGFSMETISKRRAGDHPLISKEPVTCVLTSYVAEVRELKAKVAALESGGARHD